MATIIDFSFGLNYPARATLELEPYNAPAHSSWNDKVGTEFQNKMITYYNTLNEKESYYIDNISKAVEALSQIQIPDVSNLN